MKRQSGKKKLSMKIQGGGKTKGGPTSGEGNMGKSVKPFFPGEHTAARGRGVHRRDRTKMDPKKKKAKKRIVWPLGQEKTEKIKGRPSSKKRLSFSDKKTTGAIRTGTPKSQEN